MCPHRTDGTQAQARGGPRQTRGFIRRPRSVSSFAASDGASGGRVEPPDGTPDANAGRVAAPGAGSAPRDRSAELLAALPAAVVAIDARGRVRECNDAARELLGAPIEGALWRDVIARAFEPRGVEGDAVLRGAERRVRVSIAALPRSPGQIVVLQEVTEERRRQAELARRERLAAVGETIAGLVHQLRTPLASALLDVARLESLADPAGRGRALDRVHACLKRLDRLVNDMLRYARGAAPARSRVAIAMLIGALNETLQPQLRAHAASWHVDDRAGAVALLGNADELLGALQNLVANALEASGRHARLTLTVTRAGGCVAIAVRDDGPGMPDAVRARAGEPFFTTRAQGTGLGLALARAIARAHGGDLTIDSRPGEGCEVTMRLPVLNEEEAVA